LTALGHYSSAQRFLNFIITVIPFKDDKIQIMYGIRGEKELTELELDWLTGYEGSTPVRVGNDAYKQKQNDIYGILIDAIYQYFNLFRHTLSYSEELCRDGLMYRYRNQDDFGLPRSSFTICTFWMIKSLYKIGAKEEAERIMTLAGMQVTEEQKLISLLRYPFAD